MPQPQFTGQTAVSMPQQQFPGTDRAVSMPQRHFRTSVAVPRQQFPCPDSCLYAPTAIPEPRLAILAAPQGCLEGPVALNLPSSCSTGLCCAAQGLLLADLLHICSICCIWLGWLGQPRIQRTRFGDGKPMVFGPYHAYQYPACKQPSNQAIKQSSQGTVDCCTDRHH